MKLLSLIVGILFLIVLVITPVYGHGMAGGHGSGCGMRARHTGTSVACCMHYSGCCPMGQGTGCCHYLYHDGAVDRLDAENIIERYLRDLGNPNMEQGEIKETEQTYIVDIVTKENSLIERVSIDKETGHITVTY